MPFGRFISFRHKYLKYENDFKKHTKLYCCHECIDWETGYEKRSKYITAYIRYWLEHGSCMPLYWVSNHSVGVKPKWCKLSDFVNEKNAEFMNTAFKGNGYGIDIVAKRFYNMTIIYNKHKARIMYNCLTLLKPLINIIAEY